MYVGDMVKMKISFKPEHGGLRHAGIVVKVTTAWAADPYSETMAVDVMDDEGVVTTWYDWHLDVVSSTVG